MLPLFAEPVLSTLNLPPILKWAGGKRWLVPELAKIWSAHPQYNLVEPFCGGLAIALGLNVTWARLNDINQHLINFYRQIQAGLTITVPMLNDSDAYYQARNRFNQLITLGQYETAEAAGLFYYLNRTCYNGLCRFNKKGGFNVPFGRYKTINYTRDFLDYKPVFYGWTFLCGDFEELECRDNDFVYADPPYDVEFTSYSSEDFTWKDQIRLAKWLSSHKGPVVVSNQATERVIDLYTEMKFDIKIVDAPRRISCNGDRTPAKEMIATRNLGRDHRVVISFPGEKASLLKSRKIRVSEHTGLRRIQRMQISLG